MKGNQVKMREGLKAAQYCLENRKTVSAYTVEDTLAKIADALSANQDTDNAAAMREALDDVLEKIDRWRTDGVMEHWQYSQLFDIADSALSLPARNCDKYETFADAKHAWENLCKAGLSEQGPLANWLFAPAAEQKRENDGRYQVKMREALVEIRDTILNGGFDGRSPAHFVNLCDAAPNAGDKDNHI